MSCRRGIHRQSDYTRKTQQLAQQRKEAEALQQDYAQRVQHLNQFAQNLQQQPDIPEPQWTADPQAWERLRHEDPVQFVLEKDAARDRQLARQERAQQMQYLQSEQQQLQQQQFAQHLETERQNLLELIPAWSDKETAKTEKGRDPQVCSREIWIDRARIEPSLRLSPRRNFVLSLASEQDNLASQAKFEETP
jgi:hypothetical protein